MGYSGGPDEVCGCLPDKMKDIVKALPDVVRCVI